MSCRGPKCFGCTAGQLLNQDFKHPPRARGAGGGGGAPPGAPGGRKLAAGRGHSHVIAKQQAARAGQDGNHDDIGVQASVVQLCARGCASADASSRHGCEVLGCSSWRDPARSMAMVAGFQARVCPTRGIEADNPLAKGRWQEWKWIAQGRDGKVRRGLAGPVSHLARRLCVQPKGGWRRNSGQRPPLQPVLCGR